MNDPAIPAQIDAYEAGTLTPYRLAWALGQADPRAAWVRKGQVYAVDEHGHLLVRDVRSVDEPQATED